MHMPPPPTNIPDTDLRRYLEFAHALADATAPILLEHFRRPLEVRDKGDGTRYDPVTAADQAVESLIRARIETEFPDHGIAGEEFADRRGASPLQWIIDPIDGTQAFISGLPVWGTLIGLCLDGRPIAGLMNQPFVGERFVGSRLGAELHAGGRVMALRTGRCPRLADASLFATTPAMFDAPGEWPAFARVSGRCRHTRYGADCYAYCLLAAGLVDLVIESSINFHDVAALVPIIEHAGGIVSDWRGAPATGGRQVIAACTLEVHAEALELLASAAA
jgi:myo-inositol-1(or 4)-monophosphatase